MNYRPRQIERAFPLKQASLDSVLQEKRPAQGTQTPGQSEGVVQSPTFRKMPIGGYWGSGPVEMNSTPPDGCTIKSEWNFLDAYGSWSRGGASSETVGF